MWAFIIAALVAVATLALAVLQVFGAGMSDRPGAESGAGGTLWIGLSIAALIAASHFLPSMSW